MAVRGNYVTAVFQTKFSQDPIPERAGIKRGKCVTITPRKNPKIDFRRPHKPCARSGHAAVADSNNLYIFGGYNPDLETLQDYFGPDEEMLFPLFQEVWRYNFDTNMWRRLNTRGHIPMQLASMSMVLFSSYILVFGGTGFPFGPTTSNDVWYLNLKDKRWKSLKAKECETKQPVPGYGQAMAVIGNHLHVYGGTTGWDYNSDVHRCNLTTGQWERLFSLEEFYTSRVRKNNSEPTPQIPKPRYRHEILTDGKRLYVIGGGTSVEAYPLDKIHAFNLETNEWELMTTLEDPQHGFPENRRCHGCAQLDNEGYVTGGYSGKRIFDDIWRLELKTLQWTRLEARLPQPVYFHSSAVTPTGCLYCHGGVISPTGDERSDSLTRIWLKTPSLVMTCWERVLSLIPDLHIMPERKLMELGIPRHLLERMT
ncbi:kelch domain-containing protein 10-like [Acanthaster planci]|uniref:Kelch domain-containing protein 10 n=1 Tax=Acanthaster planci TaxID=133434 RepID=A0A8B7ZQV7_ACAPL|nr:kelch domain-containing protein 10-like [Acanthaster planci]